jgi:hypothetical protein
LLIHGILSESSPLISRTYNIKQERTKKKSRLPVGFLHAMLGEQGVVTVSLLLLLPLALGFQLVKKARKI